MEKLNLIAFLSDLNEQGNIRLAHKKLFETLETKFNVTLITPEEYDTSSKEDFCMVFISSGGTEGKFVAAFDKLPKPVVLLTDGLQNSLAASLEISTWARQNSVACSIIHGEGEELLKEIEQNRLIFKAKQELKGKRIGVIGQPSSWLIASSVDFAKAKEKWGVEFIDIPLSEVDAEYAVADENEARKVAETISHKASSIKEPSDEEMVKASKLYLAIKKVAENHDIEALTIQCFSL
ncbi:MAG: fucose isomerase, partial [Bacteroidales bacterium]|nr:fucose isomerase [Bacteroidales bacterium]